MKTNLHDRIEALQRMPCAELKRLWRETFGEDPRSGNVTWMRKRLAWAIQAKEYGGLSEATQRRIEELTPVALAWMPIGCRAFPPGNGRLPPRESSRLKPGTTLTRRYKERTIVVDVRDDGFEYNGALYRSLSAVAKAVTGSHWNGNLFFFGRNGKPDAASA